MFASHLFSAANANITGEISITDVAVSYSVAAPGFATARYQVDSDTQIKRTDPGTGSLINYEQWCTGDVADYEVRATLLTGIIDGGTFDTWLSCSTDRFWSITNTDEGTTVDGEMLIQIRDVATQTVQDSATITLEATVF